MSNQRGNTLVAGIIIGVLVAGGLVGAYYFGMQKNQSNQNVSNQTKATSNNELKFNGIISEVSDKRPSDGALEIKVDDKWVQIDIAGDPPPNSPKPIKGEAPEVPVLNTEQLVGKKVEVYAKVLDAGNLTIYGSPSYYVKVSQSVNISCNSNKDCSTGMICQQICSQTYPLQCNPGKCVPAIASPTPVGSGNSSEGQAPK